MAGNFLNSLRISQFLTSIDVCAPQYMKNNSKGVPIGQDVNPLVINMCPMSFPIRKYILLIIDIKNNGAEIKAWNLR